MGSGMTIDLFQTCPFRAAASLRVRQWIVRGWSIAIVAVSSFLIGGTPTLAIVFIPLKPVPSVTYASATQ